MKVIESMTRIVDIPGITIRVWREENDLYRTYDKDDLLVEAWNVYNRGRQTPSLGLVPDLADALSKLPRVNAVEVIDGAGNGVVVYPEWP